MGAGRYKLVGAGLLAVFLAACGEERPRPDVVWIVVDTVRADRLSTYGYPRPTSPFLDRLAREGTLFLDCTAQSSWTLPSMVSMFTGHYLSDYRDYIDDETPTLPEAFQRAGYRTVGAAANILLTHAAGFGRGFGHYDPSPRPRPEGAITYQARSIDELLSDARAPLDRALERDGDGQRPPVFFYLHPFDPHDPYDDYPELHGVLPPKEILDVAPLTWQREVFQARGPTAPPEDPNWFHQWRYMEANRAYYDLGIRHTDDRLAEAFEEWRAKGLLDNAVVVFASDHGEGLWDHVDLKHPAELAKSGPRDFFYQKHGAHLFQEAVHTPLVMWGAGVPAGLRVEDPVENVDIFPTLLELAGVAAPGPLHGQSLVPTFRGARAQRPSVHSYVLHGTLYRDLASNHKLIEPSKIARERMLQDSELYRLNEDPLEREDRASADPASVLRLSEALSSWRQRYPTESTYGRRPDPARAAMLNALGYTEAHTGENP